MREYNTTKSDSLGKLDIGSVVEVLEEKDGWMKIKHNGKNEESKQITLLS